MELLQTFAGETARLLYLAAPFLLLGLAMAGLAHILLPEKWVAEKMGRPGLKGAATAALVGVPLPVCSCGVVPLAVELRRKKAGDPAAMAFLITTPESGADSILFTWGLMGPVMAIARPVSAFITAMIGAVSALLWLPKRAPEIPEPAVKSCCSSAGPAPEAASETTPTAPQGIVHKLRTAFSYGFGDLFDEIAFWLVLGLGLGGVLTAVLPSDLAALGLGQGFLPMLLMLAVGIPLYMCASASTPVAAALMAKGLSPGAALVFLLAGPATNAASLVVLTRTFGRRFIQIYLAAVAAGALVCGLLLDLLIGFLGVQLVLPMAHAHDHGWSAVGLASSVVLVALLIRAGFRGSLTAGWRELVRNLRPSTA